MNQKKNLAETVVICGAGIAGVATAYYLAMSNIAIKIILIDKNQPLSFTTSKSGENFRDFWPQKCMRDFSIHSIGLMKELREKFGRDAFKMNFSGYNFVSEDEKTPIFTTSTQNTEVSLFEELTDTNRISLQYPYLGANVKRVVSIKNAGNIDVYGLGSNLLKEAKKNGVIEKRGEIVSINKKNQAYEVLLDTDQKVYADKIVLATGPFLNNTAHMLGIDFPIENTLQSKFIIPDPEGIIPRDMPFTIYADTQYLGWSDEEKRVFKSENRYQWLLEKFPGGLHIKPEGDGIKLGWAFNRVNETPTWVHSVPELFSQVVLKGASRFIPKLACYEQAIPSPLIEYAGYYTRTKENWPLIGPTEASNVYVIGALSGFGTMTACAAGELCAQYILKEAILPDYAPYFHPNRYENDSIINEIQANMSDGQL